MPSEAPTINRMGRKKSNQADTPKPVKQAGVAIFFRAPPPLGDALQKYLDTLRPQPDRSEVLRVALEDFLQGKGFWPGS